MVGEVIGADLSSAGCHQAAVGAPKTFRQLCKGPVRMLRPNLFRRLSFCCLSVISCAAAIAQPGGPQYGGGGGGNGYWNMPGVHVPQSQYQAPQLDYYVGQKPKLWDDQQPVEQFLTELSKRSWIRVEYLHWSFARPGSVDIGAPLLNVTDPLVVFDNQTGLPAGEVVIPNMGNMSLDDTSGVRGTWGLDLASAEFELEFFGTEKVSDSFGFFNLASGRTAGSESEGTTNFPNVVTPLLTNGTPVDAATANYLIYDSSFETQISSRMWGAEATLLSKSYVPGEGFGWQWLGGFRYLVYEEQFRNRGVYNNGGAATDVLTTFGGNTVNNLYGPEVGARMSANHRWFSLSATPRIAFALNDYTAETQSSAQGLTESRFSSSDVDFTPLVQVSFKGELHVTPHFSLFGGYDLMWMYRMSRPFDNMNYDSSPEVTGGGFIPEIGQHVDMKSFYARGFSIGGVLRY